MAPRRRKAWYDDDSFWRDFYPAWYGDARMETEASRNVPRLLRLARPKGRDVLDLCCGPGRYAVPLSTRGYRVTGVDRTRFLLNKARARAKQAKAKVEWVTRDMRDFVRPASFDLVINMGASLGYFEKESDDLQVLRNVYASLRPGGVLVVELRGKEWIAQHFDSAMVSEMPGGGRLVQRRWVTDDWTILHSEWILIRRGRAKTYHVALRLYSGQELKGRFREAGFRNVKLYGGLDGSEFGLRTGWLVAVGRKGGRR